MFEALGNRLRYEASKPLKGEGALEGIVKMLGMGIILTLVFALLIFKVGTSLATNADASYNQTYGNLSTVIPTISPLFIVVGIVAIIAIVLGFLAILGGGAKGGKGGM